MAWTNPNMPAFSSAASASTWFGENQASMGAAWSGYRTEHYIDPMDKLRSQWPTYSPQAWQGSPWQTQYEGYKTGMDSLLARIGAGPQASDNAEAMAAIAQMYGYSPASWTAMQSGMADRLNASNVMASAANLVTDMQNSPFGQEQAKAMRVSQRNATEAVGQQLEAIFGERGGLGGFQAAYDLTSQLQSQFLQQQSQNSLAMFDRALSAVNAENGYYQDLINRGVVQGQDYLKFRWDSLQTAYQDYATSMDQMLRDWQTQESVTAEQFQTASANIQAQIDSLTSQMAAEMGYATEQEYLKALYAEYVQPLIDAEAMAGEGPIRDVQKISGAVKTQADQITATDPTGGWLTWPLTAPMYVVSWVLDLATSLAK